MNTSSPESSQAITALCQAILADGGLIDGSAWSRLIVVGKADAGHSRMFGYRFDAQGDWEAVAPNEEHAQNALRALQEQMLAESPSGRPWRACLIRIASDGRYGMDFEYDNANRWAVTPRTLEERIAEFAQMSV